LGDSLSWVRSRRLYIDGVVHFCVTLRDGHVDENGMDANKATKEEMMNRSKEDTYE
jgi:hypothetical protein